MDAFDPIISAHKHSSIHRDEILSSDLCGCFYCLEIYLPTAISEWTDKNKTALCPKCGIDSVIGSNSKYPITFEFLSKMQKHWF